MPKKRYWRGTSFSDRRQAQQQRRAKAEHFVERQPPIPHETRQKLLREPRRLAQYIKHARPWEALQHFTIPELFHAGINTQTLVHIVEANLVPCYYPERMTQPTTPELIQRSKRTTLHSLFPFGTPVEVIMLMKQKRPTAILFKEIVAWSLLNAHVPSESLARTIGVEALHTVLSHHPAYRRNMEQ